MAESDQAREKPGLISDQVASRILSMISEGELTPGQRLPGERQLAEKMGVSRVSVRAALQNLKAQGFLEAVQGGGTRVLSSAGEMQNPLAELLRVNTSNMHDLAEIRAMLEVWAAKRAAQRATPEQIDALQKALEVVETRRANTDTSKKEKISQEFNFHYQVAKAADSAVFMHIMNTIRDIIQTSVEFHEYELFQEPKDDQDLMRQHREVFEGIRDGDGEKAATAMRNHLSWVLDSYENERQRHRDEDEAQ